MNPVFFGPRVWDAEGNPYVGDPEPATCLDCGGEFLPDDGPCGCHDPEAMAA